jgi:ribosomal protein L20
VVEDIKIHNYNYIYEKYIQYLKKNEIEKNKKIIVNLKDLVNVDKIEKIIRKIDKPKN